MAGQAHSNRELYSSRHWKEYLSFASDIDLTLDGPDGAARTPCCRRIRIGVPGTTGVIVLQRPDGTNINTTGCLAGEILDVQASKIISAGTTVTNCTVFW